MTQAYIVKYTVRVFGSARVEAQHRGRRLRFILFYFYFTDLRSKSLQYLSIIDLDYEGRKILFGDDKRLK